MPLTTVYDVTKTLKLFLEQRFQDSGLASAFTLEVSPKPPDQLEGNSVLGLYLYHISEDGHYKNLPAPGPEQPPIRYTSMALNLYYQLTSHSDAEDATGPEREQDIMSFAVKALHDYPVIDSSTVVNNSNPLDPEDRLRIVLQPIPHNEVVSFWTAGSSPLRLAAYYQVSVVLLEPEESRKRAGRVLSFSAFSFPNGAPRLEYSENVLSFSPDPAAPPRRVVSRPAQVPLDGTATFRGSDLTGDRTLLVLKTKDWDREGVLDDVSWNLTASSDRVSATVRSTVQFADRSENVVPGIYSALVRVVRTRTLPDGGIRQFKHSSNETPFAVTARLDGDDVRLAGTDGSVTIQGYGFEHPDLPADAVQVYVADTRLETGTSGALSPGKYAITSTYSVSPTLPDDPQTLELVIPAGLTPGSLVPLRIFVNGAESPPKWIQIP